MATPPLQYKTPAIGTYKLLIIGSSFSLLGLLLLGSGLVALAFYAYYTPKTRLIYEYEPNPNYVAENPAGSSVMPEATAAAPNVKSEPSDAGLQTLDSQEVLDEDLIEEIRSGKIIRKYREVDVDPVEFDRVYSLLARFGPMLTIVTLLGIWSLVEVWRRYMHPEIMLEKPAVAAVDPFTD